MDNMTIEYAFKGFIRAIFEGLCYNIVLPAWYIIIKIASELN